MSTSDDIPPIRFDRLPAVSNGQLVPFMSAKRRTEIIDRVFDATGGETEMAAWVERDDKNRAQFYGWFVKGAFRGAAPVDAGDRGTKVEELLARLDAGEGATVISNDYTTAGGVGGDDA